MKINWGTGIVIAFGLFITFILYFVIKVQTDSKYDNDLVVEEYYKHDAHFGDEMVRKQNAQDLKIKPVVVQKSNEVVVAFPKNMDFKQIKGTASLYRPSNKKFDFEVKVQLESPFLHIPKTNMVAGNWELNLEWNYKGVNYLTKESIYIK